MSQFRRRLPLSRLTLETVNANPWFRELLHAWKPAGTASEKVSDGRIISLRLGIRDGYMTFYCGGQQIAYVKCTEQSFYEKAHHKYLGLEKPTGDVNIRVPVAAPEQAGAELTKRITASLPWQGAEKTFVDEVVGANADVFDLELALSYRETTRPVALRLDLAALEADGGGWRIALWEAKRARDGRSKAIGEPKTVQQHLRYATWLNDGTNADDLIEATRASCRALVHLHGLAVATGHADIAPLGTGIVAVGTDPNVKLTLDRNVRYVIDARDDVRGTFLGNGHDAKLRQAGCRVQVIGQGDPFVLDAL